MAVQRSEILMITPRIRIPLAEFDFSYTRSSGPGGQNVNKVNSKATMRWPVRATASLPADVRARFFERFGSRVTTEGDLIIHSQRYRDQGRNVVDCLDKLRLMLTEVAVAPKKRRPTKPSRASKQRRLEHKRATSAKKQQRGWSGRDE